jgi:hypothetical protein
MKTKLILVLAVLSGFAFTFSGCKKSNNNPSGPALTPKQVSSQIALNIQQTLYDGFGAFSLTDGFNSPGNLGVIPKGRLRLNSTNDPLCGTIADTTLNYSSSEDGVTASVKGELKFTFSCTGGILSGFNIFDNLTIAESTADFSVNYKLAEDLTLTAVDPSSDTPSIILSGTLSLGGDYIYKTGSKGKGSQNFAYTFHSVTISGNSDIVSGSADFTTSGTGSTGVWNYTGTVTFLGNGKANVVINGTTYNVDLQTGVVS